MGCLGTKKDDKERVAVWREQGLSRKCARCKALGHESRRPCGKKDCEVVTKEAIKEAEMTMKAADDMLRRLPGGLAKYRGFDYIITNPPFGKPSRY